MMMHNLRSVLEPDRPLWRRIYQDHVPAFVAAVAGVLSTVLAGLAVSVDPSWFQAAPEFVIPALVAGTSAVLVAAERWIAQRFTRPEWELRKHAPAFTIPAEWEGIEEPADVVIVHNGMRPPEQEA